MKFRKAHMSLAHRLHHHHHHYRRRRRRYHYHHHRHQAVISLSVCH